MKKSVIEQIARKHGESPETVRREMEEAIRGNAE